MHPVSSAQSVQFFPITDSGFAQLCSNTQKDELLIRNSALGSPDTIRRWLLDQQPDPHVEVLITWSSWMIGICTVWEIFADRWDDFCYPSTDDVVIRPHGGQWVLVYTHDEVFQFVGSLPSTIQTS